MRPHLRRHRVLPASSAEALGKWAKEKRAALEANRKTADWCKRSHKKLKPLAPIRVAGPDLQAKVLKFIREVLNYACEKEEVQRNVAKAKFLTRLFKKG